MDQHCISHKSYQLLFDYFGSDRLPVQEQLIYTKHLFITLRIRCIYNELVIWDRLAV